jgi:hypothetical protein
MRDRSSSRSPSGACLARHSLLLLLGYRLTDTDADQQQPVDYGGQVQRAGRHLRIRAVVRLVDGVGKVQPDPGKRHPAAQRVGSRDQAEEEARYWTILGAELVLSRRHKGVRVRRLDMRPWDELTLPAGALHSRACRYRFGPALGRHVGSTNDSVCLSYAVGSR